MIDYIDYGQCRSDGGVPCCTRSIPLYSLSGLAVGLLVGFTGVGGGSLMTPLLVLVFGIHPATAVGTDLLYAGLTKISGIGGAQLQQCGGLAGGAAAGASGSAPAAVLTLLALSHFGQDSKTSRATSSQPRSASRC